MAMNKDRKIIIGIGITISFILLIISISLYFDYRHDIRKESRLNPEDLENLSVEEIISLMEQRRATEVKFHSYHLLPFIAFVGLFIGILVYYILSDKLIQKEHSLKNNAKIILNFLKPEERKVIETLLEKGGSVQQYELSHLPSLNKVKTHRILLNLEQKGIIHKEKLGKINKIVLNKELYDVLK